MFRLRKLAENHTQGEAENAENENGPHIVPQEVRC